MDLPSDISPSEVLSLFLNEKIITLLVTETNRYAEQKLLEHEKVYWTDNLDESSTNTAQEMWVKGSYIQFLIAAQHYVPQSF